MSSDVIFIPSTYFITSQEVEKRKREKRRNNIIPWFVICILVMIAGACLLTVGLVKFFISKNEYSQTDLYYFQGHNLNATILSYPKDVNQIEYLIFNTYAPNPILVDDHDNYCIVFYLNYDLRMIQEEHHSYYLNTSDTVKFKYVGKYVYECEVNKDKEIGFELIVGGSVVTGISLIITMILLIILCFT